MPPTTTPAGPESPAPEPSAPEREWLSAVDGTEPLPPADPDAPLSFVPHAPDGAVSQEKVKIRTGRYGELEEHELVRLLDNIEDERARGRFRESVYISFFVWLAIAWFIFYGPRVLWHAPRLKNPGDVLHEREMASITLPLTSPHLPTPRPTPPPRVDANTLERLRTMTREAARRTPAPAPAPPPPANLPNAPTPTPRLATPTPPVAQPRLPVPAVADAPTPQAPTRPNFNTGSGSAGDDIQQALRDSARSRGGGGFAGSPRSGPLNTGVDVLSDTQGVDFDPYLRRILADIKRNWLPLIPEEARPPLSKQGETLVRFKINPDGSIAGMYLDGSTHDEAINRSCWSAITSENQFPPLPAQFHGPNLELRIHFLVNKGIE